MSKDKTRVMVLGANGMLGHQVSKVLESQGDTYETIKTFSFKLFDESDKISVCLDSRMSPEKIEEILQYIKPDYLVNCIGLIKQQTIFEKTDFYRVNSQFPKLLAKLCKQENIKMIHITSDCVFSGNRGNYSEFDFHDASDDYGISKSLGEDPRVMNLRTSIIGTELPGSRNLGLLEWLRNCPTDNKISGFMNHYWNGVTTLALAKEILRIIDSGYYQTGTFHLHSGEVVNKNDLLVLIAGVFKPVILENQLIKPIECATFIDRSLVSKKTMFLDSPVFPSVEEQLLELRKYENKPYRS